MKQMMRNVQRVLIAEIDEDVRRQLSQALCETYDVSEAANGQAAMEMLHDGRDLPDAVITDVELDGMDALDVMGAAHTRDPHLPVFIVTLPQQLGLALEALRRGARDCLVKPLDRLELVSFSIERALEERAFPEEKARLQRELREANRFTERLLRLATEDFRHFLTDFDAYSRALTAGVDSGALLARVRMTASWMNLRTQQMAVFAELQKFPPKMNPTRLSLRDCLDKAAATVPIDPSTHEIDVVEPLPAVLADAERTVQILQNLLCNAVQYSTTGGRVKVEAQRDDERVSISVTDAGQPIPETLLPHVFQPFARQDRPMMEGVYSTGLGLSIVKSLVESQQGRVSIENTPHGVAFRFSLMAAPE